MRIESSSEWVNYYDEYYNYLYLDDDKVGKWMYFYGDNDDDYNFIEAICKEAIGEEIVVRAKHRPRTWFGNDGVACFYVNCDDISGHKRVIEFFIENNMIKKTKNGKYTNISFKLTGQTVAGEYGDNFHPQIRLSDFIDLATGEWLDDL